MALKDVSQIGHLHLAEPAKKAARAEEPQGPGEQEDKISLSLKDLEAAVSAASVAAGADRAKVVQELANAVRQGTYKPDPQRIAQDILEDARLIAQLRALLNR